MALSAADPRGQACSRAELRRLLFNRAGGSISDPADMLQTDRQDCCEAAEQGNSRLSGFSGL